MAKPAGPDHDQRLKVLLKEFLQAFFRAIETHRWFWRK